MSPVNGHELTIQELANCLKIIRMRKTFEWEVPEKPTRLVPQQNNIVFMGTAAQQVRELDTKAIGGKHTTDTKALVNLK